MLQPLLYPVWSPKWCGKTLEEAKSITKQAVAESLDGLPKEKIHCSNLGAQALGEAIKNYEENLKQSLSVFSAQPDCLYHR